MTRQEAGRVAALLHARYPHADITVTRIPGGLRAEIHTAGASIFAVIASEHSRLGLGNPQPRARPAGRVLRQAPR